MKRASLLKWNTVFCSCQKIYEILSLPMLQFDEKDISSIEIQLKNISNLLENNSPLHQDSEWQDISELKKSQLRYLAAQCQQLIYLHSQKILKELNQINCIWEEMHHGQGQQCEVISVCEQGIKSSR